MLGKVIGCFENGEGDGARDGTGLIVECSDACDDGGESSEVMVVRVVILIMLIQ